MRDRYGVGETGGGVAAARPAAAIELGAMFKNAIARSPFENQTAVAKRAGYTDSVVSAIVTAERRVPRSTVLAVARAIDPSPAWLDDVERQWERAKSAWAANVWPDAVETRSSVVRPQLINLLRAQLRGADRLPYQMMMGRVPTLTTLYVEQQAMVDELNSGNLLPGPAEPVGKILQSHPNILVTADAGGGKSTMLHQLAAESAQWWLTSPESRSEVPPYGWVVPVRVRAAHLVHASLPAAIAMSVRTELWDYLDAPIPEEVFQSPPDSGLTWLVLVDGLDEILGVDLRKRLIESIARRIRETPSAMRFVVSSRPLDDTELAPMREVGVIQFKLKPFNSGQLHEFAGNWFAAQDSPGISAEGFLRAIQRANLQKVVHLPLLATIAAVVYEQAAQMALPTSRAGLYKAFFHYLLDVRQRTARNRSELVQALNIYRHGEQLASWLFDSISDLLEYIGDQYIQRSQYNHDDGLLGFAMAWVTRKAPVSTSSVPDWHDAVRSTLIATGVVRAVGADLAFTHQSFAEYFAGMHFFRWGLTDGLNNSAMSQVIQGLNDEISRPVVMFALGIWRDTNRSNDTAPIVKRLLQGSESQAILASNLFAEGISTSVTLEDMTRERLLQIAHGRTYSVPAIRALGFLSPQPAAVSSISTLLRSSKFFLRDIQIGRLLSIWGHHLAAVNALMGVVEAPSATVTDCVSAAWALVEVGEAGLATDLLRRKAFSDSVTLRDAVRLVTGMVKVGDQQLAYEYGGLVLDIAIQEDEDRGDLGPLHRLMARLGHVPSMRVCVSDSSLTWETRIQYFRKIGGKLTHVEWYDVLGFGTTCPPRDFWDVALDASGAEEVIAILVFNEGYFSYMARDRLELAKALSLVGAQDLAVEYLVALASTAEWNSTPEDPAEGWAGVREEAAVVLESICGPEEAVRFLGTILRDSGASNDSRLAAGLSLATLDKREIALNLLEYAVGGSQTLLGELVAIAMRYDERDIHSSTSAAAALDHLSSIKWPA